MIKLTPKQKELLLDLVEQWNDPQREYPYLCTERTRTIRSLIASGLFAHWVEPMGEHEHQGFLHAYRYVPTQAGLGCAYELKSDLFTFLPDGTRVIVNAMWHYKRGYYDMVTFGKRWGTVVGVANLEQGRAWLTPLFGHNLDKSTTTFVLAYKVELDEEINEFYKSLYVPLDMLEVAGD